MTKFIYKLFLCGFPLFLTGLQALAQEPAADTLAVPQKEKTPISFKEYGRWLGQDFVYVVKSPLRWRAKGWAGFAGTVGGGALLYWQDENIRGFAQANKSPFSEGVSKWTEPFGSGKFSGGGIAVLYAVGRLGNFPKAERTSLIALESWVGSAALVYLMKMSFHRQRPYEGDHKKDHWGGPSLSTSAYSVSFPSGHSVTAFSIASSAAYMYRDVKWVPPVLYTLAGLAALSRVHDDKHWASDIFVGSAIGYFVGRCVAKRHEKPGGASKITLSGIRAGGGTLQASFVYPLK